MAKNGNSAVVMAATMAAAMVVAWQCNGSGNKTNVKHAEANVKPMPRPINLCIGDSNSEVMALAVAMAVAMAVATEWR